MELPLTAASTATIPAAVPEAAARVAAPTGLITLGLASLTA